MVYTIISVDDMHCDVQEYVIHAVLRVVDDIHGHVSGDGIHRHVQ
jgi:hypothetical protein